MAIEVKVPVLPESVSDATIAAWHKKPGDAVKRDENLVDLETDKVVLEVPSPVDGVIRQILKQTGDTVTSQQLLAVLEEGAAQGSASAAGTGSARAAAAQGSASAAGGSALHTVAGSAEAAAPAKAAPATKAETPKSTTPAKAAPVATASGAPSPAARRVAVESGVDPAQVPGSGRDGRVIKEDVINYTKAAPASTATPATAKPAPGARPEERVPMTRMRAKIAERLMQSKNSIAMLTSFNEINLGRVSALRKELGESFEKTHGIKLGFMSFFVRAACEALKRRPIVNASVDGNDVLYHGYQDISVAVSTERGLVTPVLRDAQSMDFAEIEKTIAGFARKAREGGLTLEDLQGGTFTITNGGTFGSLFSTPIVNPPQSAILGMHTIKERAVVENGQVIAAPMMYVAISYDHRIIDGKDAVLFLVDIKNQLENPQRMLLGL